MKTIIGVFDDATQARRAMEQLRDGPLMLDDVSILSKADEASGESSEDVSAGEGAAVGAVWGGLVGLAALLIPGVGPFIAGGALFAALTGAVTGAVVGGIAAALIDFSGIPEEEARGYESDIRNGKTLVAVKARDEDAAAVQQILTSSGADDLRGDQAATSTRTAPSRVMMYDEEGQRVEQAHAAGASRIQTVSSSQVRGIYDYPANRLDQSGQSGQTWTRGEFVGEGQGEGPRRTGETWTSGEFVGEGQGEGPHKDTGTYNARQWVGEGQGDRPTTDDTTKRKS